MTSSYTITIAADDGSAATTVFQIDVRDETPKLMKVSLVAAEGQDLSTKALSAVNAEWLLSAVLPKPAPAGADDARVTRSTAVKRVTSAEPKQPRGRKGRSGNSTERVYRVMPDDFVSSFGRTTMADLAQTYAVPLYTVQSWVNTARKQGKLPPARKRRVRS